MAQPKITRSRAPRAPASPAEDDGAEAGSVTVRKRLKAAQARGVDVDVRVSAAAAPSLLSSASPAMAHVVKRTAGATPVLLKPRMPSTTRHAGMRASLAALRRLIREPQDRSRLLLTLAIGGSLLVHLIIIGLRFSPFDLSRFDGNTPPMEVALVNAKSLSKPAKADVLAQANLDGGGNTDADRKAKSPLPVLPKDSANPELAAAAEKVAQLEQQTKDLMTQIKARSSVDPRQEKPTEASERPELPTSSEMMQRTLELMRLEAQIDKDMEAYQKRPKRRFIGARAQEYRFARYVEDWRAKVEAIGNRTYPEAARAQKLYGSLQLSVSIRANGRLEKIEIDRSSGHKILDAAAVRVVKLGAPYMAFPPEIRRDTDILTITRTWSFMNGDASVSK